MATQAIEVRDDAVEQRLELRGVVDVAQAASLHKVLLKLSAGGNNVAIDCRELERLDCASLQLLLSFQADLKAQSRSLRLCQVTPELGELIALAGLRDAFVVGHPPDGSLADRE